jgi:hypothetical protein
MLPAPQAIPHPAQLLGSLEGSMHTWVQHSPSPPLGSAHAVSSLDAEHEVTAHRPAPATHVCPALQSADPGWGQRFTEPFGRVQLEPWQAVVLGQTSPQPPQLSGSRLMSTQACPQQIPEPEPPSGKQGAPTVPSCVQSTTTQLCDWQLSNGGQLFPQLPQLAGSEVGSEHPLPQQFWLGGHALEQVPQLLGSDVVSVQLPPQHWLLPGHWFPHPPQLAGSVVTS